MELLECIILCSMENDMESLESIEPNFDLIYGLKCDKRIIKDMLEKLYKEGKIDVSMTMDNSNSQIDIQKDWFQLTEYGNKRVDELFDRLEYTLEQLQDLKDINRRR